MAQPADACVACHPAEGAGWKISPHARGAGDPLFAAMREKFVADGGEGATCDACHAPAVAGGGAHGIVCDHCHTATAVKPGSGAGAIVRDESGARHGPLTDAADTAHPIAADPMLYGERADLCLACHAGAPGVCATPTDYALSPAARFGGRVCQDCHMSLAEGAAAIGGRKDRILHGHAMTAAHDKDLAARGADLELSLKSDGDVIAATAIVANKAAGHSFPSGFPLRAAAVRFRAVDADGRELWSSWKSDPFAEAPDSILARIESDADGKGPALPWKTRAVLSDTRIAPRSARAISAKIPGAHAARISAELVLFDIAPPAAATLGLPPTATILRTAEAGVGVQTSN